MQKFHLAVVVLLVSALSLLAEEVNLGNGSYTTQLTGLDPRTSKPWQNVEGTPKISNQFRGSIPTNDWCSSLVWSHLDRTPYSEPMFAHPLAMKTGAQGLSIGYTRYPIILNNEWQGTVYIKNSIFQYTFREDLLVGLENFSVDKTVLDQHGDWHVKSLWQSGSDKLYATFGHGLPYVFFEKESTKPAAITFKQIKENHHFAPYRSLVYKLSGFSAQYDGGQTRFSLDLNAGSTAALAAKVLVSYDFDGDGQYDKAELYSNFATDADEKSWESYTEISRGALDPDHSYGEFSSMQNGTVKVDIWKTEGNGVIDFRPGTSFIQLPYNDVKLYFGNGTSPESPALLSTSPQTASIVSMGERFGNSDGSGIAKVWANNGHSIAVTLNGNHYAFFAPGNSQWQPIGGLSGEDWIDGLQCDNADFWTVALLPDDKPETFALFAKHAFAFVRNTSVSYDYDEANAVLSTNYSVTTELMENGDFVNQTLQTLYPHQVKTLSSPTLTDYSYVSPRGRMRLLAGNTFSTQVKNHGLLPALPNVGNYDRNRLKQYINEEMDRMKSLPKPFEAADTYWHGKELGRVCELIQIADQIDYLDARNYFLSEIKKSLETWLKVDSNNFFYYNQDWGTLIGYPASFASETQLNDHHFHYSYFVKAAAMVAQFDPQWAQQSNWGAMINLIIKDVANSDKTDSRFPFLRNFDPYAGHSWASGHASFYSGNNHESSSESMNFSSSVILWGENTGQKDVRDLGLYLYITEYQAIRNYWFNIDQDNFPDSFPQTAVGMNWGDGGTYGTWWTANPEEIHGINYLPVNGASLYLGYEPDYILKNFQNLKDNNYFFHMQRGEADKANTLDAWTDILMEYLALTDPDQALAMFESNPDYQPEFGESKAHTFHWLNNLKALGHVDTGITANTPVYAVFDNKGDRTYVAYNGSNIQKTVTFSDGTQLTVSPHSLTTNKSTPPTEDLSAPTIPQDFVATSTSTAIQLAWSASTDNVAVAGYDIFMNDALYQSASQTQLLVEGLTPNQSYSFAVRAFDSAGNKSAFSSIVSVQTKADETSLTLTLKVTPAGTGQTSPPTGSMTVQPGTQITVIAQPNQGYTFSHWSCDSGISVVDSKSMTTTVTAINNGSLTANFTSNSNNTRYKLTVISGEGSGEYLPGEQVAISALIPNDGRYFFFWDGDGNYIQDKNSAKTTITMPANDMTVIAAYKNDAQTFILDVQNGNGGGIYPKGATVTIQAVIPEGFSFDKWTGGVETVSSLTSPLTTLSMPGKNVVLTASFKGVAPPTKYQLTVNSGSGSGQYASGSSVTVIANSANDGYVFDKWIGDTGFMSNASAATATVSIGSQNVTITATYKQKSQQLHNLTIISGSGSGQFNSGDKVSISALIPTDNRQFFRWDGDIQYVDNVYSESAIVTMPDRAVTLIAAYKTSTDLFALDVHSGNGSGIYQAGAVVNIDGGAIPDGFTFDSWTGDVRYVSNIYSYNTTVTMPSNNVSISATYKGNAETLYQLTIISGDGSGNYKAGETVSISALVPTDNREFFRWDGDIQYLNDIDQMNTSFIMPGKSITLIAAYQQVQYTKAIESRIIPVTSGKVFSLSASDVSEELSGFRKKPRLYTIFNGKKYPLKVLDSVGPDNELESLQVMVNRLPGSIADTSLLSDGVYISYVDRKNNIKLKNHKLDFNLLLVEPDIENVVIKDRFLQLKGRYFGAGKLSITVQYASDGSVKTKRLRINKEQSQVFYNPVQKQINSLMNMTVGEFPACYSDLSVDLPQLISVDQLVSVTIENGSFAVTEEL